jgi:hypothetical protein
LIPTGEQSGLQTHIAMRANASLRCADEKADRFCRTRIGDSRSLNACGAPAGIGYAFRSKDLEALKKSHGC